jgi:hypothetical protein
MKINSFSKTNFNSISKYVPSLLDPMSSEMSTLMASHVTS